MTYEIVIKEKNKQPVIAFIKDGTRTVHRLRGMCVEDVESDAKEWIKERTPKFDS